MEFGHLSFVVSSATALNWWAQPPARDPVLAGWFAEPACSPRRGFAATFYVVFDDSISPPRSSRRGTGNGWLTSYACADAALETHRPDGRIQRIVDVASFVLNNQRRRGKSRGRSSRRRAGLRCGCGSPSCRELFAKGSQRAYCPLRGSGPARVIAENPSTWRTAHGSAAAMARLAGSKPNWRRPSIWPKTAVAWSGHQA